MLHLQQMHFRATLDLVNAFFLIFFFYILTTFLFYRLFDNVLMKTYSLCGHYGDMEAFKETRIYGEIASK